MTCFHSRIIAVADEFIAIISDHSCHEGLDENIAGRTLVIKRGENI
jgi:hypothetical protein